PCSSASRAESSIAAGGIARPSDASRMQPSGAASCTGAEGRRSAPTPLTPLLARRKDDGGRCLRRVPLVLHLHAVPVERQVGDENGPPQEVVHERVADLRVVDAPV